LSNSQHDRKQVEIIYESQFPTNPILKYEIKNKSIKKGHRKQLESTRVNQSNLGVSKKTEKLIKPRKPENK
jgi:hypothetical protein